jgi:ribonuclease Y
MDTSTVVIILFSAGIGYALALFTQGALGSKKLKEAEKDSEQIVTAAKDKADRLVKEANLEAKDLLLKMKSDFESEAKETRTELKRAERRLIQKEENIDRKTESIDQRDKEIKNKEKTLCPR